MPDPTPGIIAVSNRFRQELLGREREASTRMVRAYGGIWARLLPRLDAITADIEARVGRGEEVSADWLRRQTRYRELLNQVAGEIARFAGYADLEIQGQQTEAVRAALAHAQELVGEVLPPGLTYPTLAEVGIAWNRLPDEAVANLVGVLGNGSPLRTLLDAIPGNVTAGVSDALLNGVAQGWGPRKTAAVIRRETGMGLSRALRISRTETLRSYRTASRRQYEANPRIVKGWRRHAAHDERTCFLAGTLVETEQGTLPIESIRPGTRVLTHTGRYQPVAAVMQKSYSGRLVTLCAESDQVTSTSDHPFLTERQSQLNWREANSIGVGDKVIRYASRRANQLDRVFRNGAIERSVIQANNPVASALKPSCLASVLFLYPLKSVPVGAVDLYYGVQGRNIEVNGIAPVRERVFLQESDADTLKALADSRLWFSLPGESTVATNATKFLVKSGNRPVFFAASGTSDHQGGAVASLRAVPMLSPRDTKLFAAPLAVGVSDIGELTSDGAVNASSCLAEGNSKRFAAALAAYLNMYGRLPALLRTIRASIATSINPELLATLKAGHFLLGLSGFAALRRGVRVQMLELIGAFARTEPAASGCMTGRQHPSLVANRTGDLDPVVEPGGESNLSALRTTVGSVPIPIANVNPRISATDGALALQFAPNPFDIQAIAFHAAIISQAAWHNKGLTTVYNLEVEGDHSYVANGFVVHNCLACLALDGKEYSSRDDMDDHVQGRCALIPKTISYADLGLPVTSPPVDWEKGEAWFDRQSAEVQERMMGAAKYRAWKDGKFEFNQLAKRHDDPDWGPSWTEASLKDLKIEQKAGGGVVGVKPAPKISAPPATNLATALEQTERKIRADKVENLYAFDSDGRQILSLRGTENTIEVPAAQVAQLRGKITVHNHPGGSAFSVSDVQGALLRGEREMRVVATRYTHSLQVASDNRLQWTDIEARHAAVQRERTNHYRREIQTGRMTLEQARDAAEYDIWRLTFRKSPSLTYSRTEVQP